jgi:hypothetical protein
MRGLRGLLIGIVPLLVWMAAGCRPTATPPVPVPTTLVETAAAVPARAATDIPQAPVVAGGCTDGARFVEDLTIPDGSVVGPGARLDKRWSVQNTGSCDWGPDYRLERIDNDGLTGPAEVALYPARAGTTAVWQVEMQAPMAPGEYFSRWQARAPDGSFFGDAVYVVVVVGATVTETPFFLSTPD